MLGDRKGRYYRTCLPPQNPIENKRVSIRAATVWKRLLLCLITSPSPRQLVDKVV